ncbi:ferritin-like domain-containing protein [Ahniella affigens]|nr:ferritin-like protein [Ahniella affigens]
MNAEQDTQSPGSEAAPASPSLFQKVRGGRRRQMLTYEEVPGVADSAKSLLKTAHHELSLEQVRRHLQTAIEIEHATIPTYLCALYSIHDGTNTFAVQNIQGVVMEEMLHMLLACNILNAIGGHPAIDHPKFIPEYPTYLPHSADLFLVPLQKFSRDTIQVFLDIEKPAHRPAPPQPNHWDTIGQFYKSIKFALIHLERTTPGGIFHGDPARQMQPHHYYGGGGKLVPIHNLDDAVLAIDEIVGQGEGVNGTIIDSDSVLFGEDVEYAHYFRFNEIMSERRYRPTDKANAPPSGPPVAVDWNAVYAMRPNPKMADYPEGSELYAKTLGFNRTYMALLTSIHNAVNGDPPELMKAVPLMYDLKYQALELMVTPWKEGMTAGPSFEYVPPAMR